MTFAQLQEEHREWSVRNFGEDTERTRDQAVAGMIEELGELAHATIKLDQGIRTDEDHRANAKDAIADLLIFTIDALSRHGVSIRTLLSYTTPKAIQAIAETDPTPPPPLLKRVRRLATTVTMVATLLESKTEDQTRRLMTRVVNDKLLQESVVKLVINLAQYCLFYGWDFQQIVESTWAHVSQRDWQANAATGQSEDFIGNYTNEYPVDIHIDDDPSKPPF